MNDDFSNDEKNGLYKAIFSRRDVRSHFTSDPIDDEVLSRILNAAHHKFIFNTFKDTGFSLK